ncbi:MAG: regulatory iron-sulfur-containing complex subunit RicT [Bacteroidota bacterium]
MEEKIPQNISQEDFSSRGCCHSIKPDHKPDCTYGCAKMEVYDWLKDVHGPKIEGAIGIVEIRFKNNRKDYFQLPGDMDFVTGDIVAVEASPGHDIGIISATGEIVKLQLKRKKIMTKPEDMKKVYRKARISDIEKWALAIKAEETIMLKTRKISSRLGLNMKVNDVEYQGDNTKAIFYYTAEERVDFREMIKILAEEFRVRIEMKQIGVRQEAGRLGGLGTCGRSLCCSSWITDFRAVTTNAARVQQLSMNPQKLAGQCGKLKCCLNYEYDTYVDAIKEFPDQDIRLKTKKGEGIHQKTDIFQKILWYSYQNDPYNLMAIPLESVHEIIRQNNKKVYPEQLEDFARVKEIKSNLPEQEDVSRYDGK